MKQNKFLHIIESIIEREIVFEVAGAIALMLIGAGLFFVLIVSGIELLGVG